MEVLPGTVVALAAATAFLTRSTVDALRNVEHIRLWLVMLLVFLAGQVYAFLLWLIMSPETQRLQDMTQQQYAIVIIAGIVASFGAIGANNLASKAKPTDPPSTVTAPARAGSV